jgi:predicted MFS family arabinose efflux permease
LFLFGIVAGSIADRYAKKRVMLALCLINLTMVAAMTFVIAAGVIDAWHIHVCMLAVGAVQAVDFSVRRSYYSEVVEPDLLANAMTLESVALTGSSMFGPAMGGFLLSLIGYAGTWALMAALDVVGFVLMFPLPAGSTRPGTVARQGVGPQLRSVAQLVRGNATVLAVLLLTMCMNLFAFGYRQLLPVIARDDLEVNSALYGVLSSASGLGAVVGSLVIATRQPREQRAVFSLGSILALAGLFCFSLARRYVVSLAFLIAAGIGMSGYSALHATIVLQATPSESRGRAMGALLLAIGVAPLGTAILGQLAETLGPRVALAYVTGTGLLVTSLLRWRVRGLRCQTP